MTTTPTDLYLELLKRCLTGFTTHDGGVLPRETAHGFDEKTRAEGRDWPRSSQTMIGLLRLENLRHCIVDVVKSGVPGDFIETGVWRGGATIFMRGVLAALGVTDRQVWVADSFQGVPPPNPDRYPIDAGDELFTFDELAVSVDEVRGNFEKYGLLDDQVRFLPGWFSETLPAAPIERLAIARLDGDLYESTIVALETLYPKLSEGGYLIVDDYALPRCRAAVDDFRLGAGIDDAVLQIDWSGIYWRKSSATAHQRADSAP